MVEPNLSNINHMNPAYLDVDIQRYENRVEWYRTFNKNITENLLDWHYDGRRTIEIMQSGNSWGVQFEGSEPIVLHEGDILESPEKVLHRAIKFDDKSDLILKITEYND